MGDYDLSALMPPRKYDWLVSAIADVAPKPSSEIIEIEPGEEIAPLEMVEFHAFRPWLKRDPSP